MSDEQQRLLKLIEEAFSGVQLGDGVSLHETVVLDDYGSHEQRQAARANDEKLDWRHLIDDPELIRPTVGESAGGGLVYYDTTGFRFHLPAYLSRIVKDHEEYLNRMAKDREENGMGHLITDLLYNLSRPNLQSFISLNANQRTCVQEVLKYLRELYVFPDCSPLLPIFDQVINGLSAPSETTGIS